MALMQKLFLWQKHGLNKKGDLFNDITFSRMVQFVRPTALFSRSIYEPYEKLKKKTLQKEFNSLSAKFNNVQILKKFLRSLLLWKLK